MAAPAGSTTIVTPRGATIRTAATRATMGRTISLDIANANGCWYASGLTNDRQRTQRLDHGHPRSAAVPWLAFYLDGALSASGSFAAGSGRPDLYRAVREPDWPSADGAVSMRLVGRLQPVRPGAHPQPRSPALHAGQRVLFRRQPARRYSHADCRGAVYDLAGAPAVTLGSLSDLNGGGGMVTNSVASARPSPWRRPAVELQRRHPKRRRRGSLVVAGTGRDADPCRQQHLQRRHNNRQRHARHQPRLQPRRP